MHPLILAITLLLFLGTGACILIGWLAWRRRNEDGALLLIVLMFGCGAWSFGYGMELFATTIASKRLWYDVSYLGIALVAPAWLGFMLQIAGYTQRLPRVLIPLLFVESAILVILNQTNHLHGLLWKQFYIWNWYGQPFLVVDRAAGFLVHTAYAYLLLIIGFVLYGIHLLRSPRISYLHLGFLLLGVITPFSANILDVLEMPVLGPVNLTPLALITIGVTAGWYIFRFRITDLLLVVGPTVFQQMEDGVIILDLERIVRNVNPAAVRLLNRGEIELLNQPIEVVLPWAAPFFVGSPASSRSESSTWRHEVMPPGATERYFELTMTQLYNQRERLQGQLLVVRDVTERKQIEEALRHAHRMEGVGLLAGGIAHDFNNLLTSMIAQNSLALYHLPSTAPARKHIEKSNLSADRAADLTRQLLAYAGKGKMMVESLNLNEAILENIDLMETAIPKKAQLTLDLADKLAAIQADRGHIQSIVMNLVLNAVESIGEDNGEITIRTRVQNLPAAMLDSFMQHKPMEPGAYVCLSITDTGRGMSAETVDQIFDPFFSTKSGSRGLGLSTTLGIVHSHGGSMRVQSSSGQGASFDIILPISADETVAVVPTTDASNPEHSQPLSGAVLVIDDEEPVREALADLLGTFGLQVHMASNGQEGIQQYERGKGEFDLVLLDMSMPVMDGAETHKQLRARSKQLPILLMSGYSEAVQDGHHVSDANTRFIHKPYTSDKLKREITTLIRVAQVTNDR